MSAEIIKMIDDKILDIKKIEGVFDKTFPTNKYLLDLKKAWQENDLNKVTLIVDRACAQAANTISAKTTKANEKNILEFQKWINSFASKLTADNPIIKYADHNERTKYGDELSCLFKDCTHEQLSALAAQLIIEREIDIAKQSLLSIEAKHLRDIFLKSHEKRINKGQKGSKSIKQLHNEDDETLDDIYEGLMKELGAKPSFRRFQLKVESLDIKPKIVKEPRLTPEEKLLNPKDLAHVIEEKKKRREGKFTDGKLRIFYKAKANQKATTKTIPHHISNESK